MSGSDFLLTIIVLVLAFPGCLAQKNASPIVANVSGMPQIRSLSVSGPNQAAVVVGVAGTPRDLKLSKDGGQNWLSVTPEDVYGPFESATFIANGRGWGINQRGQVFTTYSGGSNWTMTADIAASDPQFIGGEQIQFFDENRGWILEGLSIWRSEDGGFKWVKVFSVSTPGIKGRPTSLCTIDASTLAVSGSEGQVFVTRDGGKSWKVQTLVSNGDFTDVSFMDKQSGWLTGYVGSVTNQALLFSTKDGGVSWQPIFVDNINMTPSSVCFVGGHGWLAGESKITSGQSLSSKAVLLRSDDSGVTWTSVKVQSDDLFFTKVRFADEEHGWLVGRNTLFRTDDGGNSWNQILDSSRSKAQK